MIPGLPSAVVQLPPPHQAEGVPLVRIILSMPGAIVEFEPNAVVPIVGTVAFDKTIVFSFLQEAKAPAPITKATPSSKSLIKYTSSKLEQPLKALGSIVILLIADAVALTFFRFVQFSKLFIGKVKLFPTPTPVISTSSIHL